MVTSTLKPFTYADYCAIDDELRREVHEGEMVLVPAPNRQHQRLLTRLTILLGNYVLQNDLGEAFVAPFDLVPQDDIVLQPDLMFIAKDRLDILDAQKCHGAPDLVVEVTSPSTSKRDAGVKKDLYRKIGVKHYWLIDLQEGKTLIFDFQNPSDARRNEAAFSDDFSSEPFPGLAINIERLLSL